MTDMYWHKGRLVVAALWIASAALAQTRPTELGLAPPVEKKQYTGPDIEQFIKIRWPVAADLAPNGTLFYVYYPDGINQLYAVHAGSPQTSAKKLTSFADGINSYSLSYDGNWIVAVAAEGGSEQNNLYLLNPANAQMRDLFVSPEIVYEGPVWRRDSKAFAYRANDEDRSDFHVYLYDLESGSYHKVFSGDGYHYAADFNRDGTKLIVGKYHSASYSQLFEVTLGDNTFREITPQGEQWSFEPIGYNADESALFVVSDYKGDLRTMHAIDLKTLAVRPILKELSEHEVDFGTLNEERTVLAVGVNEDGYGALHLFDAKDLSPIPGPPMAKGIVGNIRFTGGTMLYSLDNANTPGLIYRWELSAAAKAPKALTEADTQGIDVSKFRLPELVHYKSFDGTEIPAYVYLPADYQEGQKIPFIVQYHGGPEGQYRPSFNRSFQYFLTRGFGIIAPNVRGSSGYGKAFIEADNYKNRMKSVRDGVWAAKYVIERGYTEPGMVGAWGGSYGGFMVMATITEAPELFGAACNVVGIVNFQTFLEQTKDYRRHLREAEYGPLSDPEFLKTISPIYNVDKITTPLMLAHGLNDPRVPIGEALQIAIELTKRGQSVEQLYFPDEGHGFAKEENRLVYYRKLADFFDEYLRK